jgi:16S rRNA (guanine(966)-N(2))-methyltransferase RsmD
LRELRPTSNLVKQALFNILYSVKGKDFLDLFAGTGQIGMAALEKGAKSVVFVDIERERINQIREKLKNVENVKFVSKDVLKYLKDQPDESFDIVFADPPYDYKYYDKLIKEGLRVLRNGGMLIVEHRFKNDLSSIEPDFYLESRKYGDTVISFWRKQ